MDEELRKTLEKLAKSNENLNSGIGKLLKSSGSPDAKRKDTNFFGSIIDEVNPVKKITGAIDRMAQMGINQTNDYTQSRVLDISNSLDIISDLFSKNWLTAAKNIGGQIITQLEDESILRTKINEETGLTGKLSEDVRRSIINATPAALQMGYGIEKLSQFYTDMIKQSGRFNIVNQEVLTRAAQVSRAFVGDLSKLAEYMNTFEKVGIGSADTLENLNEIGVKSLTLGLRSKKTIEDVTANLEKINAYGFKNGVQGLAEMARKSTEFRVNMQATFDIAEKVFDPDKAIDMAANLSIIGGAIGDFNDPLKLMYMATNNVEGLQDALINATKSLATYNDQQGRFELTGINLRKARAMADQFGMKIEEVSKMSIAAAERTQAASALMSTGLQMKDEDREFLTNMAQMEKGEMVIKVPESLAAKIGSPMTVQLSQMTESLKKDLLDNRNAFAKMDAKDIAMEQLNLQEKINRNVMAIAAVAKVRISEILRDTTTPLLDKAELMAGKFGNAVEDYIKVDPKSGKINFITGAEDLIKKVEKTIGFSGGVGKSNEMVSNYMKGLSESRAKEAENKSVEIKHIHEYNASPSLLDNLGRFIARSPQTWEDIYSTYHEDPKSFTYSGGF